MIVDRLKVEDRILERSITHVSKFNDGRNLKRRPYKVETMMLDNCTDDLKASRQ